MAEPTLYHLLGIGVNASTAEIKVARRTMLMAHHPDRAEITGVDPVRLAARTRAVIDACNLLFDHSRRAAYDVQIGASRSRILRRVELAAIDWRSGLALSRAHDEEPSATSIAHVWRGHSPRRKAAPFFTTMWRFAYETRAGQWLLVIVLSAAAVMVAGHIGGAGHPPVEMFIMVSAAVVLSRGGPPTPLSDAETVSLLVARFLLRATRSAVNAR